ncbi:hypothetical protein [Agromyces allii]|uniref:Uncharacterized protein n=1 Tax=Agromyces allii TaxID=393607 RepID=A0ABN2RAS5_9MICO|nr:hypothetical protein [Agromyces allii]
MTEHADGPGQELDAPIMEQNDRTVDEALGGIVAQTRADLARSPDVQVRELLRQRLRDAGIVVADDDFEALLGRASSTVEPSDPAPGSSD